LLVKIVLFRDYGMIFSWVFNNSAQKDDIAPKRLISSH